MWEETESGRMRGNMIKEKEYTGPGYYLTYVEKEEGLVITGYGGRALRAEVPEQIEGVPVVKIEKKAFLSRKVLHHLALPESIQFIDDWAFAYCSNLKTISLPSKNLEVGRSLFLECSNLQLLKSSGWMDEVGRLLAAAVTTFTFTQVSCS